MKGHIGTVERSINTIFSRMIHHSIKVLVIRVAIDTDHLVATHQVLIIDTDQILSKTHDI